MKSLIFWAAAAALSAAATAHDFRAGDIVIDHPYALPSLAGNTHGVVYLRTLKNTGSQPERLIGASTAVAATVELHHMEQDAAGVMRMRVLPALELPAGAQVALQHGGAWHVMLLDLKRPLKVGERFALKLKFARAGEKEVQVWVQEPSSSAAAHAH